MVTFRGQADYKAAFTSATTELISLEIEDRQQRIQVIDALIEEYVAATGKRPPQLEIFRLTNHILREELSDKRNNKNTSKEYPFLGRKAVDRRHQMETSLGDVEEYYDSNRQHQGAPVRRTRSKYENLVMDGQLKENKRQRKIG